MQKALFAAGAFAGLTAVALASLAAHGLASLPPSGLALVHTATQILAWHAFALLGAALWLPRGGRITQAAGLCFAAGTAIFCTTVVTLGLGISAIAWPAPIGGTLLLAGWALLLVAAFRAG